MNLVVEWKLLILSFQSDRKTELFQTVLKMAAVENGSIFLNCTWSIFWVLASKPFWISVLTGNCRVCSNIFATFEFVVFLYLSSFSHKMAANLQEFTFTSYILSGSIRRMGERGCRPLRGGTRSEQGCQPLFIYTIIHFLGKLTLESPCTLFTR